MLHHAWKTEKKHKTRGLRAEGRKNSGAAWGWCFKGAGDNGRVLGYDNSHGFSHRHYMGLVTEFVFTTYEELYEQFEMEWREIAIRFVNGEL